MIFSLYLCVFGFLFFRFFAKGFTSAISSPFFQSAFNHYIIGVVYPGFYFRFFIAGTFSFVNKTYVTFGKRASSGMKSTFSTLSIIIRQLTVSPGSKFLSDSLSSISTGNTFIFDDSSLFTARLAIEFTVPEKNTVGKCVGFNFYFQPLLILATSTSFIFTVALSDDKSGS